MNDGKIIIDKIIAEAEEAAKASLAKGQKEADAVLKAAQEKVNKELDVFDRNAQAEAEKAAAKEISGAQMQAKKAILETKQEILAETIAEAEKRLLSLDDAAYAKVIGGMLKKLDRSLGTEILVLPLKEGCGKTGGRCEGKRIYPFRADGGHQRRFYREKRRY